MKTRPWRTALALCAFGCAGLSAEQARDSYLKEQMADRVFPATCRALWSDALKVIAQQGYEMTGSDRQRTGQDERGFLGNTFSAGHATTENSKGVLEAETDWTKDRRRYRVKGYPEGIDGCQVRITAIQENPSGEIGVGREWRDFDMELAVLARVSPKDAAQVEAGAPH
ncbi:MAG TPA: hypothetical protein VMK42_11595 [Anaeromyxobacteraceae bacterium]|nr:hypothetical protein [Anaeromyxobacteraceae bacterium]